MITEISFINQIVGIKGHEYNFEQVEIMNETQVFLYLSQGNVYLLTAYEVKINEILQTSSQMIADTFNA